MSNTVYPNVKPTIKQWKYAKAISNKLNIPMPKEYTKKSYYKFIRDNKYKFHSTSYYIDDSELDEFFGHLFMG